MVSIGLLHINLSDIYKQLFGPVLTDVDDKPLF